MLCFSSSRNKLNFFINIITTILIHILINIVLIIIIITVIVSLSSYEYLGCYADGTPRDLSAPTMLSSGALTFKMCAEHCKDHEFFELQVSSTKQLIRILCFSVLFIWKIFIEKSTKLHLFTYYSQPTTKRKKKLNLLIS